MNEKLVSIGQNCNCLTMQRAARATARKYDEAFRVLDISNGQFSILVSVAVMQTASIQAIAERLSMDRTTVTAALKPLQRRNLITVETPTLDRRCRNICITKNGLNVLKNAIPIWENVQKTINDLIGGEQPTTNLRHKLSLIN